MLKGRSIWRVIAVNAGLLTVGLLAAELVFGHWFESGGLSGLRVPRNVRLVHEYADRPGHTATYHRDRFGLRARLKKLGATRECVIQAGDVDPQDARPYSRH
jgi:hypothetical protein